MKMTARKLYGDGDLRVGWASWDDGSYTARSIKYAYEDKSGKISRGSPELPFDILLDMLVYAAEQGELDAYPAHVKSVYDQLEARVNKSDATSE